MEKHLTGIDLLKWLNRSVDPKWIWAQHVRKRLGRGNCNMIVDADDGDGAAAIASGISNVCTVQM